MRTQLAAALLALAARVHAIEITSPSKNDVVDPSAGVTVKWSTVSTDPSHAHLVLVNMASGHTPFTKDLGDVDLSKGSLTISAKDVPADAGYQFNFESVDSGSTGILAQSQQFGVKAASDDSSSSSSSSDAASSTSAASQSSTDSAFVTTVSAGTSTAKNTSAASTLSTTASSQTATASATRSAAASSSTSTGAAVPTGRAVQGGSLLALVAGLAVVVA